MPSGEGAGHYIGRELELFEHARNWKQYWSSRVRPYVRAATLEVGAGLGANVAYLLGPATTTYLCLEPDARLCEAFRERQRAGTVPARCELVNATLDVLPAGQTFDTITYIDVLEHIADDHAEFARAYARLRPGGHLVVLGPAHRFLFSRFDEAVGHYRRLDRRMLLALSEHRPMHVEYLDCVGMAASLANRLLLAQSRPDERQIRLWDRWMVPLSRLVDPCLGRRLGKSILGVWRRPG